MHSVQKRDALVGADGSTGGDGREDSATRRLSAFADGDTRWGERQTMPFERAYHTSYQGERIERAGLSGKETREGSSDEDGSVMGVDVESGRRGQKMWTQGLA